MNDVKAEALYFELRANLPGGEAREALSAVLEVHRPIRDGRRAACRTCKTWAEDREPWPCETVAVANQWAHVDAIAAAYAAKYADD